MLLIAGLLGIAATGLLLVDILPGDDPTDADAPDLPEHDRPEDDPDTDEERSSPLSEASEPEIAAPATTPPQDPAIPAAARDAAPAQDERDFWSDELSSAPFEVTKDQVAGSHLSDRHGAATGPVILHQQDAAFGNSGDDQIVGSAENDLLIANRGDDDLNGGDGRDGLYGGAGNDALFGDAGDDILLGEDGKDALDGGTGADLLLGGDGDDSLWGGDGGDRLFGGLGRDEIHGGAGNDVLDGTEAEDGNVQDRDAPDRMFGGDGDDTLAVGIGDTATGGAGGDLFLFRAPSAGAFGSDIAPTGSAGPPPWITDFDSNEDAIEIIYDASFEIAPGVPPELSLIQSTHGTDLILNGAVVAKLSAGTYIAPDDIRLIAAT